jgi:hypothetical protein
LTPESDVKPEQLDLTEIVASPVGKMKKISEMWIRNLIFIRVPL